MLKKLYDILTGIMAVTLTIIIMCSLLAMCAGCATVKQEASYGDRALKQTIRTTPFARVDWGALNFIAKAQAEYKNGDTISWNVNANGEGEGLSTDMSPLLQALIQLGPLFQGYLEGQQALKLQGATQ